MLRPPRDGFGEIPGTWRNLWEGFPKVSKALVKLQSQSESRLEHCSKKLRECLGFLKDDSDGLGEIPGTQRNLWDFWRLAKPQQSYRFIPSWVEETWTLFSGYGNQVQTQRSHLGQRLRGFALNLEVSIFLCGILNNYNECLHTGRSVITMYF